jgi:glycosyltransferase involved in cell wall biosynthesis
MKITVIVPTYRRTTDLVRCLQALEKQIRTIDEVIIVVRDTDIETWDLFKKPDLAQLPLKLISVSQPGVIAAMNMGLSQASGDIIAFTDDDAAPHSNWLQNIEAHFLADAQIGGVGGRDIIHRTEPWFTGSREQVGLLQWHGRVIGEHHRGVGQARAVDVLKGVNMSFRHSAIQGLRFDERMRGTGAQVHFEVAFCLALRRNGWKLIYDPAILVDHYIAQRFDEDQRDHFNAIACINAVHNETLALLEHLSPAQRLIFLLWSILVGTRQAFGLIQWLRHLPSERWLATQKCLASLQGRWQGIFTWLQSGRNQQPDRNQILSN